MIVFAITLVSTSAMAQFMPDTGKIDGYVAADYYGIFTHNTGEIDDGGIKGRHGFQFRRIYFTYNNKLSDVISMRLRLEMNSPGDITTSASLTPYVKDAYLSFKLGGSASLVAGIQGPPSFELEEGSWGLRPLEKTPLDLYKWTSSRDFGIALKGGKTLLYHFMFGQGSSNKSETNNGKKFFGSLAYKSGGFVLEGMAQYEAKGDDEDMILKGFGAYSGDWGRLGVMYAYRDYKDAGLEDSLVYNIASAFAVIKAGDKVELIGRADMNFGDGYKLDWGGGVDYMPFAPNHEFSFVLGAVSYQIHKNVWIIPNVRLSMYKEPLEGEKADNDFYGYLTLYFKF
jgi:hypothetical protein